MSLEKALLTIQGFDADEQKQRITEHLRTRLGHNQPHSIQSVMVFCDFKLVVIPPQDE